MADAAIIECSLVLAGERAGDIAPRVYENLFANYPEMQALFVRDTTGSVRGEMLARSIDVILDLLGANAYGANFVRCEVVTHEGYGVPRDIFPKFFEAIAATLREILDADWSSAMDGEWRALLAELSALCSAP